MQMDVDGSKIRKWRVARCWSQEHLAETAGLSLRTIQRLENGESASMDTVKALALAFDEERHALLLDNRVTASEAQARALVVKKQANKSRAIKNLEATLAFWIHGATYIGVIALLYAINLSSGREDLWVTWPAIGWGVGVFAYGATVMLNHWYSAKRSQVGLAEADL